MLTLVTDPDVLAQFPHLSPPKDRVVDEEVVRRASGGEETVLTYGTDPGRPAAGTGRVARCEVCGTLLRTGQPHSASKPKPHVAYDMLVVVEPLSEEY